MHFSETGISQKFNLLPLEIIENINLSLLDKIYNLNDAIKKKMKKHIIDELTKSIWFDKKILELKDDYYYKNFYFPILEKIIKKNNLQKFPEATFFVRVNVPYINDYFAKWHQDAGTFLYSAYDKAYKFKSYTLWCSLTKSEKNNSIEFVEKKYYKNKVYNSKFKKSNRHGNITFDKCEIPFNEKKIKTLSNFFNPGEAIIFDSLIYHRTVREGNNIRVSFDLRVFCENENEIYENKSILSQMKRFVFKRGNIKLF